MVARDAGCRLCGLPLPHRPPARAYDGEEHRFCCEGCARVYDIARECGILDQVLPSPAAGDAVPEEALYRSGETAFLSVQGMWCASCALTAERLLSRQPGVLAAEVSFAGERGKIRYDPARTGPEVLLGLLGRLGYRARLLSRSAGPEADPVAEGLVLQLIAAAAFGMHIMTLYLQVLYPAYAAGRFDDALVRRVQYLVWLLATPAFLYGGRSILAGALRALRARTATMDTLVALGTVTAYLYSALVTLRGGGQVYFDSVSMIVTFVVLGRLLEHHGGSQARKEIRHLLRLQPEDACRREEGSWVSVPSGDLREGDEVLVKPGERAPADGVVLEGTASVDEALLTGEATPVAKQTGDPVYAGAVLHEGSLVCRVAQCPGETRLAQITRLVEETLASRPPVQRLADRAAEWFAAGTVLVAALAALGWTWAGYPLSRGLLAGITTLVVACPCSLGLATPLALTIALGRAARRGVLIRNPVVLEVAPRVGHVVFDKTGTLTRGEMCVSGVVAAPASGLSQDELLRLAAAVEQRASHPIARAVGAACAGPLPEADEFQSVPGLGASARVAGQVVRVGSARFVGIPEDSSLASEAKARAEGGETIVWVGGDAVAGMVALRDAVNQTAAESLRQLAAGGIQTEVLSGDHPGTVRALASELGVGTFEGHCPPEEKAARIRARQAAGECAAMVGDGVNDAPALAQADVGITVAGGTTIAGETSDVILMLPDLTLVPWLLASLGRTQRIIVGNLVWAFAYNVVAIPLAVTGTLSPIHAAAAMAASSVLVVLNSLRLLR